MINKEDTVSLTVEEIFAHYRRMYLDNDDGSKEVLLSDLYNDIKALLEAQHKKLVEELNNKEMDSEYIIGNVKERFSKLVHKGWDWKSFYNGWLEGRMQFVKDEYKT